MAEQQVENTQPEQEVQPTTEQVQETATQEQEQTTVEQTQEVTQESTAVDLSKIEPGKLTAEQVAELQKGYLRQGDYTQKTQKLAEERKQSPNYAEMVQTPEFLEWAKSLGIVSNQQAQQQTQQPQEEPEFMQAFTDEQKQAMTYMFQKMAQPYAQTIQNNAITQQDEKLSTSYGNEVFTPNVQKAMNKLQQEVIANKGALFRDEAFKILDYDPAKKREFEAGRQEGLKGKQVRQQANVPQSITQQSSTAPSQIYNKTDTPQEKMEKIFNEAERRHGSYDEFMDNRGSVRK